MVELSEIGSRYMADPSVAFELLGALMEHDASVVAPEWLNCHWDHPDGIAFIVDISDIYNMAPEPLAEFMHVCWARGDTAWHHFITLEIIEENPDLAKQIYDRFVAEGPTDEVVESMLFLRASLDSDRYADDIMPGMINEGMRTNPCNGILKLWRRYYVCDGVEPAALKTLGGLLGEEWTAYTAIRAAECLKIRDVRNILDQIAALGAKDAPFAAVAHARGIMRDLSDGHAAADVARAVRKQTWHPYIEQLNPSCLWKMLGYLRDNSAMRPLANLLNQFTPLAIKRGVFTHIMELNPDQMMRGALMPTVSEEPFPTS